MKRVTYEGLEHEYLPGRTTRLGRVVLGGERGEALQVPGDQVLVYIGGKLPTPFLESRGIEIETHFGTP